MNPDILMTFGDIFSFEGKEYVYLAKTADLLYAAEILPNDLSKQLIKGSEIAVRKNKTIDNQLYCFVVLTTTEVKDRVAFMGIPQHDDILRFLGTGNRINDHDLTEIKATIINSKTIPEQLKKLINLTS